MQIYKPADLSVEVTELITANGGARVCDSRWRRPMVMRLFGFRRPASQAVRTWRTRYTLSRPRGVSGGEGTFLLLRRPSLTLLTSFSCVHSSSDGAAAFCCAVILALPCCWSVEDGLYSGVHILCELVLSVLLPNIVHETHSPLLPRLPCGPYTSPLNPCACIEMYVRQVCVCEGRGRRAPHSFVCSGACTGFAANVNMLWRSASFENLLIGSFELYDRQFCH